MLPRFVTATAFVISLLLTGPAQAQEAPFTAPAPVASAPAPTAIEAARDIRTNGLSVGLYAGFFTPIGLYRDGALIDIGIFGGDARRYFDESAIVAEHLRDFRHQKIAGVTLWSAGLAALVADLAMVCATASNRSVYHDNEAVYWGLLGGGVATSLVGAIVLNSANHSLQSAVNTHNEVLLNKYLPAPERSSLSVH